MTVPASFIAWQTFADILDGTISPIDFGVNAGATEGFACHVFHTTEQGTPTITPHSTVAPYGSEPWDAGTNYWDQVNWDGDYEPAYDAAAPNTIVLAANPVVTAAGRMTWYDNRTAILWTGITTPTPSIGRGMLISHRVSSAWNRPILFYNFGYDFTVQNDEFKVTWDPTFGIMSWLHS